MDTKETDLELKMLIAGIEVFDNETREGYVQKICQLDKSLHNQAKKLLIPYLANEKIWIRTTALDLLLVFGMSKQEIAVELLHLAKSIRGKRRLLILNLLGRLRSHASGILEDLLSFAKFDFTNFRQESIDFLRTITAIGDTEDGKVAQILSDLLLNEDYELRQEAIWGMRWLNMDGAEMLAPVKLLLKSKDVNEQKFGVKILGQLAISQDEAVNALMELTQNRELPEKIREQVIEGLQSLVPALEWDINRGLVAIKKDEGIFVAWRLLGTEPLDTGFNIYRGEERITNKPVTDTTNFLDANGNLQSVYYIRPVQDGIEGEASETVKVWEQNYLSIPIIRPKGGVTPRGDSYIYHANECSVGDLTGNGQLDIILKWDPNNQKDNAHNGYTGNVYLDAYTLEGDLLWRIDLGRNIRAGAHYTQFLVYDFDGDGKAEIIMKTADGTIDGLGNVIGDPDADYRTEVGRILSGPEYLTIFHGETGEALDTIPYNPPRGDFRDWGDDYGNRVDRFLAAVAFLDGQNPSAVMCRGYYTRTVLVAYDFKDGKLKERWVFDTKESGLKDWEGQGNHHLAVVDIDGDGKDEIVYGAMTIDHDGTGHHNTNLYHGDALHVANHDPSRPGFEVFSVQEVYPNDAGIHLRDARTGEILWGVPTDYDVGRGVAAHIDANYVGSQAWGGRWHLMDVNGKQISSALPPMCFVLWWDKDLQRELLEYSTIYKWDADAEKAVKIFAPDGVGANAATNKPPFQADLFGDWREEVIFRTDDSSELRIYTNTEITNYRFHTLLHDKVYRMGLAWQNVAYNEPPHTSYYIGEGMKNPPLNRGLIKRFLEKLEA